MSDQHTALAMTRIEKSFPGVRALAEANLSVNNGEVHGLVGENGAGKSTIIKVLAGVYRPDGGSVAVYGEPVNHLSPQSVHEAGIRFIHQEVSLVPHFNVAESVFLGQELKGRRGLDKAGMRRRAEAFLAETLGVEIDGRTLIRDLTVAQRKLIQIARALIDGQAKLVVFDEPTAVLSAEEIQVLFDAIRSLRKRGIAMVYVSHYLSEIREICDRVTVFRNGVDVGVLELTDEVETAEIITLMVGRTITDIYPERHRHPGDEVLTVDGLTDGIGVHDASFSVRKGEIVGVAGIIGSGREELIDSIYGLRRYRGRIAVDGRAVSIHSPADAVSAGLVLVPRDRRNDGLLLDMTVSDNINVATMDQISRAGWLNRAAAAERSDAQVERLDVRPRRSSTVVRFLSGGNQQKVVLARWLATDAKVFMLDDPTVGVDVGARTEIYKLIADLADNGAGVLVSSNDLGELLGLCDRVLVMVRGHLVAEVDSSDTTLEDLVTLTTNSGTEAAAS